MVVSFLTNLLKMLYNNFSVPTLEGGFGFPLFFSFLFRPTDLAVAGPSVDEQIQATSLQIQATSPALVPRLSQGLSLVKAFSREIELDMVTHVWDDTYII